MAFVTEDNGGNVVRILPVAPPPPAVSPAPPPPPSAPAPPPAPLPTQLAPPAQPVNANGETLAQAEAAVLAEVANGALGADALARHPLPPGTSTSEALRFLASLPQTTYTLGAPGGTVTGPPIDTLPPPTPTGTPAGGGDGDAVTGTGGGERSLESAYRPPGVVAAWRDLVDLFKLTVPKRHSQVKSVSDSLVEVFK